MNAYYIYYYNRFIMMGCEKLDMLPYLCDEVKKEYDIEASVTLEAKPMDHDSPLYDRLISLLLAKGSGFYTKGLTQDELEMMVDGFKFVRYHKFQARTFKIDQLLGE